MSLFSFLRVFLKVFGNVLSYGFKFNDIRKKGGVMVVKRIKNNFMRREEKSFFLCSSRLSVYIGDIEGDFRFVVSYMFICYG